MATSRVPPKLTAPVRNVRAFDATVEQALVGRRDHRMLRAGSWTASRVGDVIPAAAAVMLLRSRRSQALPVLVAAGAHTLLLNYGMKKLFSRDRPNGGGHTSSFPSGHTATAVAVAALAPQVPALAMVAAAVTTGTGRVVRGVHWTSDVVAGAAVGACAGFVLRGVARRCV
jgi:membrane-associated phospholipid phosphatase